MRDDFWQKPGAPRLSYSGLPFAEGAPRLSYSGSGELPTYEDLVKRVEELEKAPITRDRLPMTDITKWLESNWEVPINSLEGGVPNKKWNEVGESSTFNCNGAPASRANCANYVTVPGAGIGVLLVFAFVGYAVDVNSNLWVQVLRNGALAMGTTAGDFTHFLINNMSAAWYGSLAYGAPTGGLNTNRQPVMMVPVVDIPGPGTHIYSLAFGGTGNGGTITYHTLKTTVL